ncbi:helix-turn-helix domain-containing protein [bacterium]|nr:helix-turn-helix domain-containing protein [bacterium]
MLKDEIRRLAQKELESVVRTLRGDLADLKRMLTEHMRIMGESGRIDVLPVKAPRLQGKKTAVPASGGPQKRITGKMIRRMRQQLELSQADFARLVGVSVQSVRNWERKVGQLRLLGNTPQAILEVAEMGTEEARRKLGKPGPVASPPPAQVHRRTAPQKAKVAAPKPGRRSVPAPENIVEEIPTTGRMVRQQRERLGLSQSDFALLVGVSSHSVYQWEKRTGQTKFRANTATALIQVVRMGREDARRRLDELAGRTSSEPIPDRRRTPAAAATATTGKGKPGRSRKEVVENTVENTVEDTPITAKMIRHHRERLGLTQGGLAKLLNVHLRSVYQWEHKPGTLRFLGDTKKALLDVMALGVGQARRRLEVLENGQPAETGVSEERSTAGDMTHATLPNPPVAVMEDGPITGSSVRALRKQLGVSQADFARLAGVHTQTVYQWEHRPGVLQFKGDTKEAVLKVMALTAGQAQRRLQAIEQGVPASRDIKRPETAKVRAPRPAKKPRSVAQEPEAGRTTGRSIGNLRQRLSLSQADFARLVGVHTHTICQWEHKPGPLTFRGKIEDAVLAVREMTPMDVETKLEALKRIPDAGRTRRRIGQSKTTVDDARTTMEQPLPESTSTPPATLPRETPTNPREAAESKAGINANPAGNEVPDRRTAEDTTGAGTPVHPVPQVEGDDSFTASTIRAPAQTDGDSQADLARLVGVHTQTVCQWERKPGPLQFRGNAKSALLAVRGMSLVEVETKLEAVRGVLGAGRARSRSGGSTSKGDNGRPTTETSMPQVSSPPDSPPPEVSARPAAPAASESTTRNATQPAEKTAGQSGGEGMPTI